MKLILQPKQSILNDWVEKCPSSWLGYGGSRGGGKSGGIRRIMLNRRIMHPKTSGQILRRVFDDVLKNHINKMWEEFPDLYQYYKSSEHVLELPDSLGNGKIFFDGAETKSDVQRKSFGPEFMDLMVDQAEQFSEEELQQLKTTCRWPGMPLNACKFLLPFNPGGPGAAFLQRIFYLREYHEREVPADYAFLQAYGWDNIEWARAALSADGHPGDCLGRNCKKCAACIYYSWSDEERFNYYIKRTQYGQEQNSLPAHMRAGQLLGDFKKFAGQYFSNFDEAVHAWDLEAINMNAWWPVWGSLDWGYQHHSSFHWHTQAGFTDDEGRDHRLVITFREFITSHLSERALAEEIVATNDGLPLGRIWAGHDLWKKERAGETKEQAMSKVFRSHGLPGLRQAVITRVDGWRFLHRALDEGEWIITKNCREALRAIPTAICDSIHPGKEEDILKTSTMYDDVIDELRYGVYSQFATTDVPEGIQAARKVAHLTDPTTRTIALNKIHDDKAKSVSTRGLSRTRSHRHRRYAA